jgi:YD repeat-containing protein
MPKYWALGVAFAAAIGGSSVAHAQTIPDEYAQLIQQHSRIGTLDGGMFGDRIGLSTGSLEIVQTDADLPGNNALPVRVGRRFQPGNTPAWGHFGDWDLDIPHMHGLFGAIRSEGVRWTVDATDEGHRCSEFGPPPEIYIPPSGGIFTPSEYWHGTFFYLPGGGDQELLFGGDNPTSGGPYVASTREGAAVRCVTTLAATSEDGSTGEGFEVVTSDGTVYRFDQMVSREANGLSKPDPTPALFASVDTGTKTALGGPQSDEGGFEPAYYYAQTCCRMARKEFFLFPTRVTDRFGNTVTYTWDSNNPWRLIDITASDGRHLHIGYSSSDPASSLIQSVTATGTQQRTWTYAYGGTTGGLATVVQPDQQTWQFNLATLYEQARSTSTPQGCDGIFSGPTSWDGTITAPTGAHVTYTVTKTVFGRSWVRRYCAMFPEQGKEYVNEPYLFSSVAITRKAITGPGLPSAGLAWTYAYGAPNNCWDPSTVPSGDPDAVACTGSSPVSRTTTVTEPDGAKSRYTFGNRIASADVQGNEGLLLSEQHGVSGSSALRTTNYAYGDGDAAPYGTHQGSSLRRRGDWMITGQRRPQRSVTTIQQGTTFSRNVATTCSGMPYCFDTHARPTIVVRSGINTAAATQVESTLYDDDTTHWVLGQVAQRTVSGLVAEKTIFDSLHRPSKLYAFGKLTRTLTYNADGTIATVKDGNNNTSIYSGWKRGIPQSVQFADGEARSAVVNDQGWITASTDENGFATGYAYDAMGRIAQVTYPTGDSVAWAPTTSVFVPVGTAENGVAAGHWRQTISTGNARKVTLFDALWRPVLVREYDSADVGGTDHYVATTYDEAGRVADTSYPLGTAPTMTSGATWVLGSTRPDGVRTSYDGIGRPTTVQQDSELGVLTTTTTYLSGFQRRVTDARGKSTTEQFMAWDTPTFDWPVRIDAPEKQTTEIVRDVFGKPMSITRGEQP